jgi:hypothetical protein
VRTLAGYATTGARAGVLSLNRANPVY